MTSQEAAERLCMSHEWLRKKVQRREVPFVRLGRYVRLTEVKVNARSPRGREGIRRARQSQRGYAAVCGCGRPSFTMGTSGLANGYLVITADDSESAVALS